MRFFQHVLSLREIERTGQLDAWLERFDAVVVPTGHGAVFAQPGASGRGLAKGRVMVSWPRVADRLYGAIPLLGHYMVPYREPVAVTLEWAGASVLDSIRVHAAIDGHLATARGPWSDGPFVSAVLHLLASAPERAA
jgi:putative intracellular protease/amidase